MIHVGMTMGIAEPPCLLGYPAKPIDMVKSRHLMPLIAGTLFFSAVFMVMMGTNPQAGWTIPCTLRYPRDWIHRLRLASREGFSFGGDTQATAGMIIWTCHY